MARSGMTVTGDRALLKNFKRLGSTVQRRVVRRPLTAALTPINKAAKREAPKKTKTLSRSIGKKVKVYKAGVFGAVGPRTDAKYWRPLPPSAEGGERFAKPHKYGPQVEKGTQFIAPNPFMRRAFRANRSRALRIQMDGIRKNVEKEAEKR